MRRKVLVHQGIKFLTLQKRGVLSRAMEVIIPVQTCDASKAQRNSDAAAERFQSDVEKVLQNIQDKTEEDGLHVVFDMASAKLMNVSSSFIGVLVSVRQKVAQKIPNAIFSIRGASGCLKEMLAITKIDTLIHVADPEEVAV